MSKLAKVFLTKKQIDLLVIDIIGSKFMSLSDDGLLNTPYAKKLEHVEKKILKALNKTGTYYQWQLKVPEKGVTPDNIREEYK